MKCLTNEAGQPLVHFVFANGYTASVLKRWHGDVMNASVAYWPTNDQRVETTIALGSELSDDEVIRVLGKVRRKSHHHTRDKV